MRFYDREMGLQRLEEAHMQCRKHKVMNAVAGRWGVGKTRLALEFSRGKKAIYFLVEEGPTLLQRLKLQVEKELDHKIDAADWEEFFREILKIGRTEPLVVILDEFHKFGQVSGEPISALKSAWDSVTAPNILLLCMGSGMGAMRNLFTKDGGSLTGMTSGFSKLAPLDYIQVRKILADMGFKGEEQKISLYSIFGGIPRYYEFLEGLGGATLEEIISELFLKPAAPLREEGISLLNRDFGWGRGTHFLIIEAISQGAHTSTEIAKAVGFHQTALSRYLAELAAEDIISRQVPVTDDETKSKRGRYFISDHLLEFWFKCVHGSRHLIERREQEKALSQAMAALPGFVSAGLREAVLALISRYRWRRLKGVPILCERVGGWWDRGGSEIDVCAVSGEGILLGDVIWREEVGPGAARALVEKAKLVKWAGKRSCMLVSRRGFTEDCIKSMPADGSILLDLKDLELALDGVPARLELI
ncbi:MAG: DUF234 domain-containing protein [Candidatus Hadarchaeota archaeon]